MKRYRVVVGRNNSVTSVYTDNVEEAREKAREILNRPGRRDIFKKWREDGEQIK